MCLPLAAVGAGLSIVGAGAQYAQQSAQASAANRTNREFARRNQTLARQSASSQYNALNQRIIEEAAKAGQEAQNIARDSLAARSRVTAAAVEAGVKGNSVDALLADFSRQEGEYLTTVRLNESFARSAAEAEKQSVRTGLESRLVSSTPSVVNPPSLFNAALGAFGNALTTGLSIHTQDQQLRNS